MTEDKRPTIKYFDREAIEIIHSIVSERWKADGEPIPPFSTADEDSLDSLVKLPQSSYFGDEQYSTLEGKAAIIFYTLNKKHLFLNGNKRMSVACLIIFLLTNGKLLQIDPSDLAEKALWLAKTTHSHNFDEIKKDLEQWIKERMTDYVLEIE